MRSLFKYTLIFFALTFQTVSFADDKGTAQEAVALVKKAIAYYKANGREKAFEAISDPKGMFVYKDLYVFVGALKAGEPTLAHGGNPKLVGKVLADLKDINGVYFVRRMNEIGLSKEGSGWVDYTWPHPVTKELTSKSTYVERLDDLRFSAGIYK